MCVCEYIGVSGVTCEYIGVSGGTCEYIVVSGGTCEYIVVSGGTCEYIVVSGGTCKYLGVSGGTCEYIGVSGVTCEYLGVSGGMRVCLQSSQPIYLERGEAGSTARPRYQSSLIDMFLQDTLVGGRDGAIHYQCNRVRLL